MNPVPTLFQILFQNFDKHYPNIHSSCYDRNRPRYNQCYRKSRSRTYYYPRSYNTSTTSGPYKYYPRLHTSYLSDDINHDIALLLNHVLVVIEIDHTRILKATLTINTNALLIH